MVDLAGGMEDRNYCIRRRADRQNLTDLMFTTLSLIVIAGASLVCLWVRLQMVEIGYQMQALQESEERLSRARSALILEEETLKHPEQIDRIARIQLGMNRVRLNQLLPVGARADELASATSLAMAKTAAPEGSARRLTPVN